MSTPLLSSDTAQTLGAAASNMANNARFSFIRKFREERLSNLRPLGDFFDKTELVSQLISILSANLQLTIFLSKLLVNCVGPWDYAIITSTWLIFTIVFLFGGFYLISRLNGPLTIGGTALSPSTLYATYAGVSLLLLLFSGATGAIFWIIGAAALIILGHAALLEEGLEGDFSADGQV
ncbi:unnamed protein product [Mucor hiemalis]